VGAGGGVAMLHTEESAMQLQLGAAVLTSVVYGNSWKFVVLVVELLQLLLLLARASCMGRCTCYVAPHQCCCFQSSTWQLLVEGSSRAHISGGWRLVPT
jgi:hypothetical protein